MRQFQPHHPDGLDQVAFQRAPPVLVGAVRDARAAIAAANIVDQDVDAAIGRDSDLDQTGGTVGIADIDA